MSHPGPDGSPPDHQPGRPGQPPAAWVPPPGGADAGRQPGTGGGSGKKIALVIAGLIVAVVVAAVAAFVLLGGDPQIGDCLRNAADEQVEVVDCGSGDAEARIVGVDQRELDFAEFMEQEVCADFPDATNAVWIGSDENEPGTIYCAEPV